MKQVWIRKWICAALSVMLLAGVTVVPTVVHAEEAVPATGESQEEASLVSQQKKDYDHYLQVYENAAAPSASIRVEGAGISQSQSANSAVEADGSACAYLGEDNLWLEWNVSAPQAGLYQLFLEYYPLPGKTKDIEFGIELNGETPFEEASRLTLYRVWKDETDIQQDANDNDLRPKQVESPHFLTTGLINSEGHYAKAYSFYLREGDNTLRFIQSRENMAIRSITFENPEPAPSYEIVEKEYQSKGYAQAPAWQKIYQAEKTYEKSSSMLYPMSDRSSPATQPSHYSRIRLNTIGQQNWKYPGQWISWQIDVPADGLYEIAFKARQNYLQGLNCYRTMTIDGEIPFAEAQDMEFHYGLEWYMKSLGTQEQPMLVYLTKGTHVLRMEGSSGPTAEVLKKLNDAVLDLNSIYRSIIMVTGTSPDVYRTFYLEDEIPGLMENLNDVNTRMKEISNRVKELTGTGGTQASIVDQVVAMLDSLIKNPQDIPERLQSLKDNISSLGSLILLLGEQPLEFDYIVVSSQEELPKVKASFLDNLSFNFNAFVASFVEDYNSIGETYDEKESVTVWVNSGRDQAQVLKSMIDDLFTPETGIKINLNQVATAASGTNSSILVQATLAGQGPDVAMLTPKDIPINLAMRGALTDLSQFDEFESIQQRFFPSAFIPYAYQDGVYAIPETQNFDMLFYRTDILEELGLSVPQTWDEVYTAIAVLQKKNLQFGLLETDAANPGISAGIAIFDKLLLQRGGSYYNAELSKTAFDTQEAYDAFQEWTEFYTEYGLSRKFDFYNTFRTGEMPMGIQSYTMYNKLYQAAPEIRGLWGFAPVPGRMQADGTIDRTQTANGTGCIMLKDAKNPENAFAFINWWTSSEVQKRYGNELESIMGSAARYDTANVEAFESLPWTDAEASTLMEQWKSVTDIPQIPGNYFISRSLTNAFRLVADNGSNPIRTLNTYNKDMNAEIARKRSEFGLDQ